jgi:ribonuclease HI
MSLDAEMNYVYTDGACANNGKITASAGIGIYFGENDKRNVSKKITGKQTNNTAELKAIIETYSLIQNDIVNGKKYTIVSDSVYAISCATTYGEKCEKKGWDKLDIPNKELVKIVYELYKDSIVQFMHIHSHTKNQDIHSFGNYAADKLATQAILL